MGGQVNCDRVDGWSCHLNSFESLIKRSALFTQDFTIFHTWLRRLEHQVLAEATRRGSKLVQLCLDLKTLQFSLIVYLGERYATIIVIRVTRRIWHRQNRIPADARQTSLLV